MWALNSTALAGPSIWIIPAEQLVTIGPRGHPLNGASLAARRGGRLISRTTSLDAPTPVETSCGQLVALRIILLHDQFSRDRMPKIPYSRLLAAKRFKDSSPQPVDFAADAHASYATSRHRQPVAVPQHRSQCAPLISPPVDQRSSSTRAAECWGMKLSRALNPLQCGLLHHRRVVEESPAADDTCAHTRRVRAGSRNSNAYQSKTMYWRSSARICRTNHPPEPGPPWPRRRPHSKASCRCTPSVRRHQQGAPLCDPGSSAWQGSWNLQSALRYQPPGCPSTDHDTDHDRRLADEDFPLSRTAPY